MATYSFAFQTQTVCNTLVLKDNSTFTTSPARTDIGYLGVFLYRDEVEQFLTYTEDGTAITTTTWTVTISNFGWHQARIIHADVLTSNTAIPTLGEVKYYGGVFYLAIFTDSNTQTLTNTTYWQVIDSTSFDSRISTSYYEEVDILITCFIDECLRNLGWATLLENTSNDCDICDSLKNTTLVDIAYTSALQYATAGNYQQAQNILSNIVELCSTCSTC